MPPALAAVDGSRGGRQRVLAPPPPHAGGGPAAKQTQHDRTNCIFAWATNFYPASPHTADSDSATAVGRRESRDPPD